jgi:thiamine biosynthesis protein ThiI
VAEAWTTFLLRYGEIGIKSTGVRRRFEDQLEANLRRCFKRRGATALVDRTWGRFFVETPDPEAARDVLTRTFGLVHASPVTPTEAALDEIGHAVREAALATVEPGDSFAIRARRTGNHDFTSMDVAEHAGDVVLDEVPEAAVDLDDPDEEIHVEVRETKAYVFTEFLDAPGGLPMGSQGHVVVPFEGPRSPAAAWLMLRRGARVHAVVPEGGEPVVETLEPWAPGLAYTVLEGPVARRGLLAAAGQLTERIDAHAVALDEHESRATEPPPVDVPVLRPLAGLPGKRWPEGAYAVSKDAADVHPGETLDRDGRGAAAADQLVENAGRGEL